VLPEEELLRMLEGHGFKVSELGYRLTDDGRAFEYRMSVRTTDEKNLTRLAETLKKLEPIREFQLSRLGD
jgi:putative Mg2+ transporter-C (MgtC) family protein